MVTNQDYTDPNGSVYVDAFADEDEERAWVEAENDINHARSERLKKAA